MFSALLVCQLLGEGGDKEAVPCQTLGWLRGAHQLFRHGKNEHVTWKELTTQLVGVLGR